MKRLHAKLLAFCVSASLCSAVLAGCGANSTEPAAGTQVSTPEETQAASETAESGSTEAATEVQPDDQESAGIFLEPVEGISDGFIRGMDASSVLVEEKSGVKYYNFEGEEQDVFQTLAEAGVNYIRLRVWNDPYDENGNGYGGGNNDVPTAVELGKRATEYGMKVCIDFHYSDFWADPKRQHAPKAWEGMNIDEKCDALYEFTRESLTEIIDAGVDVGMVQVGNEINNGMAGETKLANVTELLQAGCRAVREISEEYGKDIQVAIHYTNITENDQVESLVANLSESDVDYDAIGLSYYAFWDGTMENMQDVVKMIQEKYGKQVFIAETSYCYTSEDGDGSGNSLVGIDDLVDGYPATVQGQANVIRDVCAAAYEAGAIGVFYWEGVWIPVGEPTADNAPIWEEFGSGWASSYAGDYDPDDAGLYYGGCSWDNQAMFDFDGHPLESLNVFQYLKTGASAPLAIDAVPSVHVTSGVGSPIALPEMVEVIYNDRSANKQVAVTWDETQIAAIDINEGGVYEVTGVLEDGSTAAGYVEIKMDNLVLNPSFEDADTSMWKVTYEGGSNPTDYQEKTDDAYTGDIAFHFWSEDSDMDFSIEQEFTDLEPGTYQLCVYAQGGDVSDDAAMELYAITSDGEQTEPFMVTTYNDWKNPTISNIKITDGRLTIGVHMKCNPRSWGTVDDFTLNRMGD
ncbi:MAG: glycosyl hydrolase 53 family protein [Lachnospiraceae bacterium]|nr:glycosyl hydrolase 53 family protein [Lachnospiraceae bacterium]